MVIISPSECNTPILTLPVMRKEGEGMVLYECVHVHVRVREMGNG